MTGFYNGNYIAIHDLLIPITSTTINRSYAAFEFFTMVNNKPFYLERHLKRLFNTLRILRVKIDYSEDELTEIIQKLIKKNATENISYKIFVIPEPNFNYENFKGDIFIFPVLNSAKEEELYKTGAKLLLKEYNRFLPEAKTTNYIAYIYWEKEVQQQGAIDVLYHNSTYIRETSRSNIFIIKNNIIYSPKKDVLKGVTRSIVIDLIQKNNILLVEKEISLEDLLQADEVFVTSTTREIMSITTIDSAIINEHKLGNITQKLMIDFKALKFNY